MNINTRDMNFVKFNNQDMEWVKFNGITVYENWKELISQGVPPITLQKCANKNLVGYKVYGNSKQQILPDGYTQLEYIESTGTQYINTQVAPNSTQFGVDIRFKFVNPSSAQAICGSANNGTPYLWNAIAYSSTYSDLYAQYSKNGSSTTARGIIGSGIDSASYNIKNTTITGNVNSNTFSDACNSYSSNSHSIYLFARNDYGSASLKANARIYSCKITSNDTLVRNLIPAKNSSNVVGLYDLVNDVFYTNAGTGTFTAGPTAPTPNAPIEIESVGDLITDSQDENYGKYKIPVTVGGKNICNPNSFINTGKLLDGVNGNLNNNTNYKTTYFIFIKSGTYTLSLDNTYDGTSATTTRICLYNTNYGYTGNAVNDTSVRPTRPSYTFTVSNDCYYRLSVRNTDINIQLEKSGTETKYEPYVAPRTTSVYLDEPLRKIGNGDVKALPVGYTQLDYLESTGTQYLDTGIILTNQDLVTIKFSNSLNESYSIFGANDGTYRCQFFYNARSRYTRNFTTVNEHMLVSSQIEYGVAETYYLDLKNRKYKTGSGNWIDDTNTYQATPQLSAFLFAQNNSGEASGIGTMKIYEYSVSRNGKEIQHLIPVKDTNGVIGMYDIVRNVFLTNQGTGTFNSAQSMYYDYIDLETQKVYRNVGKTEVLPDLQNWTMLNGCLQSVNVYPSNLGSTDATSLSNYFKYNSIHSAITSNLNNGEFGWDTINKLTFKNANLTNLNDWITWVTNNKFELVYPLATESDEDMILPDILLNKGTNVIEVDTTTTPSNMWIKYKGKE